MDEEDTPSYEDALRHNLSKVDPRWLTNEIVSPDRLLFLDGALQVCFLIFCNSVIDLHYFAHYLLL